MTSMNKTNNLSNILLRPHHKTIQDLPPASDPYGRCASYPRHSDSSGGTCTFSSCGSTRLPPWATCELGFDYIINGLIMMKKLIYMNLGLATLLFRRK